MCNCMQTVQEKIRERVMPEAERVSIDHEMLSGRTYSTAYCTIPGKKKRVEKLILHSFCPFCGEKYDKEDTNGQATP